MRIALVSTSAVSVPPKAYGGTELVIASLARGLTRRGHSVTVFATGDSAPEAELRSSFDTPVWPPSEEAELEHTAFAWRSILRDGRYDVVHLHAAAGLRTAPPHDRIAPAIVYTIHHAREEHYVRLYEQHDAFVSLVAISRRQAELMPELRIRAIVHHGVDLRALPLGTGRGGYCAFLGRFASEKGVHLAIDAATAAGVPLRIGAPSSDRDVEEHRRYFEEQVRPRLERHPTCTWLGELNGAAKVALMANAQALLFPIEWEEPFGLVMIEAMACGTPIVAFRRGSVPEVVSAGVTGRIVSTTEEMARALRSVRGLDRARCRERAMRLFSETRMVDAYERLYEALLAERSGVRPATQMGAVGGTKRRA